MTTHVNKHLLAPRLLAGGVKNFPPVRKNYTGTGGSDSARYCYGAWLRHVVAIAETVPDLRPQVIAELGPGDSLGLGVAALWSGIECYVALGVLTHTNVAAIVEMLLRLAELVRDRAGIPGDDEFPELYPRVNDRRFPAGALTTLGLTPNVSDDHLNALHQSIRDANVGTPAGAPIRYLCPGPAATLEPGSIDLVVSQAVLQDMDHWAGTDVLGAAFQAMSRWVKPGGAMSHQVNLAFPGTEHRNQHWAYGELTWKVIRGRRPYYVNRVPVSEYLRLYGLHGFDVKAVQPEAASSGVPQEDLPLRFRHLPPMDYTTRAVHFIAVKR